VGTVNQKNNATGQRDDSGTCNLQNVAAGFFGCRCFVVAGRAVPAVSFFIFHRVSTLLLWRRRRGGGGSWAAVRGGSIAAETNGECHVSLRDIDALCGLVLHREGGTGGAARACVACACLCVCVETSRWATDTTSTPETVVPGMSGRRVRDQFLPETGAPGRSCSRSPTRDLASR